MGGCRGGRYYTSIVVLQKVAKGVHDSRSFFSPCLVGQGYRRIQEISRT